MKTRRAVAFALIVAAIAALTIGARALKPDRPSAIGEERWIPLSERAGFALTRESADSSVGAELYLKTDKGWRRARLENPFVGEPMHH